MSALIAQRIERRPPKLEIEVRLLVGAQKLFDLGSFEGESEAGLLIGCCVFLNNSALHRLVYCLVGSWEKLLRRSHIFLS